MRAVDVVDSPAAVPAAILLLLLLEEADGPSDGGRFLAVAEASQEFQHPARQVGGAGIQDGPVIRVGDIVQDGLVVVSLEGRPAAVAALHPEHPVEAPPNGLGLLLLIPQLDPLQAHQDGAGVVIVRVIFVIELEGPTARLRSVPLDAPIPVGVGLFRQQPFPGSDQRGMLSGCAGLEKA